MNTLINTLFNDLNVLSPRDLMIRKKSCVSDQGDVYTAEVELAGFSKKDISIRISDGVLELDAKNKDRILYDANHYSINGAKHIGEKVFYSNWLDLN